MAADADPVGHGADVRWARWGDPSLPALLAVHCWGDESSHFQRLADALGDHQVISLLVPADPTQLPVTVGQWVDFHEATVASLLTASPPLGPPYRIIGYSFGGVIAIELARRLRQRGHAVQYVGLIDTIKPRQIMPDSVGEYLWFHVREASLINDEVKRRRYLVSRLKLLAVRRVPQITNLVLRVARTLRIGRDLSARLAPRVATDPAMASLYESFKTYRCSTVDFPVTVLSSPTSVCETESASLGWASWMGVGFDVYPINGDHLEVFDDEHIGTMANAIDHSLTVAAVRAGNG